MSSKQTTQLSSLEQSGVSPVFIYVNELAVSTRGFQEETLEIFFPIPLYTPPCQQLDDGPALPFEVTQEYYWMILLLELIGWN